MTRSTRLLTACAIAALASAAGAATPAEDLKSIIADYDRLLAVADPLDAGQRGDLDAARRWPDDSPAAIARQTKALTGLHDRLKSLDGAKLTGEEDLNRRLLAYRIGLEIEGASHDVERMPFTSDSGFYDLPSQAAEGTRLRSKPEIEAYLARMEALPSYYATEIGNMRRGVAIGFTQPKLALDAAIRVAELAVEKPADQYVMLGPLRALPPTMPAAERDAALKRGLEIVTGKIKPAEKSLADFLAHDYLPHARNEPGIGSVPGGKDYYAYRVRLETTTDLTPDQIYAIGEAEIARIKGEMQQTIRDAGFQGSFKEFLAFLRTDPQFYVTSRDALMEKASRIAKRIDDMLPGYFGKLPRLTYGVRQVPAEIEEHYTTGRYNPGSPEQGVAGGLMINTSHLDQRPLYELPALVSHEGVPGHHLQIALAQEQTGVPNFRRRDDVTAYVEGWALYTETLTGEMGLYQSPYERFGKLSMEMWRACRLVMDVGIHWKGMSRDEATSCLRDNSALAEKNIQTETDRYITWPGQALGYKIGQIKISELRAKAEKSLGTGFDIRKFHDLVLDDGPMPMLMLEQRVDAWIEAQKR